MKITYITPDKSIEVKLVYIVKRRLHNYAGFGKTWPKHTQCLCYINGLFHSFGEAVKHEKDVDDQKFAFKIATGKALLKLNAKDIRQELWKKLFAELSKEPEPIIALS